MQNLHSKRIFIVLFFSAIVISCGVMRNPIEKTKPQNNQSYEVEYLFEHDGCRVYRFYDMGNYVYFTNCNNNTTSIATDSTATRTITIDKSVK